MCVCVNTGEWVCEKRVGERERPAKMCTERGRETQCHSCQKRPTIVSKETYYRGKRDLL